MSELLLHSPFVLHYARNIAVTLFQSTKEWGLLQTILRKFYQRIEHYEVSELILTRLPVNQSVDGCSIRQRSFRISLIILEMTGLHDSLNSTPQTTSNFMFWYYQLYINWRLPLLIVLCGEAYSYCDKVQFVLMVQEVLGLMALWRHRRQWNGIGNGEQINWKYTPWNLIGCFPETYILSKWYRIILQHLFNKIKT